MNQFKAETTISSQMIADQVCTAIEGGCGYWMSSFELISPDKKTLKERPWYSDPKLYEGDFLIQIQQVEEELEGVVVDLTPAKIQSGLSFLAKNRASVLEEIVTENGDAGTADMFMQACLFEEIVYG